MKTVVTKGTSGDKVAAQVLMIQDDPLFHLNTLSSLVNSVKVSKKKECLIIIGKWGESGPYLGPQASFSPFSFGQAPNIWSIPPPFISVWTLTP
jgi:Nucleic-acid-binding protein possibly involved in ribosomal biogenesis